MISTAEGKRDNVSIFHGYSNTQELILEEFEIEEVGWFGRDKLPELGPLAKRIWRIFEK